MHDLITGIARIFYIYIYVYNYIQYKVLKKRTYIKLNCHHSYSDLYIYFMDNIDRTRSF